MRRLQIPYRNVMAGPADFVPRRFDEQARTWSNEQGRGPLIVEIWGADMQGLLFLREGLPYWCCVRDGDGFTALPPCKLAPRAARAARARVIVYSADRLMFHSLIVYLQTEPELKVGSSLVGIEEILARLEAERRSAIVAAGRPDRVLMLRYRNGVPVACYHGDGGRTPGRPDPRERFLVKFLTLSRRAPLEIRVFSDLVVRGFGRSDPAPEPAPPAKAAPAQTPPKPASAAQASPKPARAAKTPPKPAPPAKAAPAQTPPKPASAAQASPKPARAAETPPKPAPPAKAAPAHPPPKPAPDPQAASATPPQPDRPARLVVRLGNRPLRTYLLAGEQISIGRLPSNDIVIDNETVSPRHAVISTLGDGYVLRDLGSSGGTFHRDTRISQVRLNDNDRILIGKYEIVFQTPSQAAGAAACAPEPADTAGALRSAFTG